MAKRSPSRQRRAERRAAERAARKLERIERKMQRASNQLDPTKWIGQVRHPMTGQIINIPRIVPEVGSLWRCDLFGAKFMVQEVRDNYVHGMAWSCKDQVSNVVERFRQSPYIQRLTDDLPPDFSSKQEFFENLSRDLQRLMEERRLRGPARARIMDFCGLDLLLEKSLQDIVSVLADQTSYQGNFHFRRVS